MAQNETKAEKVKQLQTASAAVKKSLGEMRSSPPPNMDQSSWDNIVTALEAFLAAMLAAWLHIPVPAPAYEAGKADEERE